MNGLIEYQVIVRNISQCLALEIERNNPIGAVVARPMGHDPVTGVVPRDLYGDAAWEVVRS